MDEHRFAYGLDILGLEYFNVGKQSTDLYQWLADKFGGKPDKSQMSRIQHVPLDMVAHYGIGDIKITKLLYRQQLLMVAERGISSLV